MSTATIGKTVETIRQWLDSYELDTFKIYSDIISGLTQESRTVFVDGKHLMESENGKKILNLIINNFPLAHKAFTDAVRLILIEIYGNSAIEPIVRFHNISGSRIGLKDIGGFYNGKLVTINGRVGAITSNTPWIRKMTYHCMGCGFDGITVSQSHVEQARPAKECINCKDKFPAIIEQEVEDTRTIILMPVKASTAPMNLKVWVKGKDLCDRIINAGRSIDIFGYLTIEMPTTEKQQPSYVLWANNIEDTGNENEEYELTPDDVAKFSNGMSKEPDFWEKSVKSFAPEVIGMEDVKEALILQCASINLLSESLNKSPSHSDATSINLLLAGTPGTGKTALLLRTASYAPNSAYTSFATSTPSGLTVIASKDKDTNQFMITPGFFPSCHRGISAGDEFDKSTPEIFQRLHEIGSNKTCSYARGTEKGTLPSDCAWLFACNSVFPYWDEQKDIQKNLKFMPPSFITRFDSIFVVLDRPNPETDALVARRVLENFSDKYWQEYMNDTQERFGFKTMKKYIMYVAKHVPIPKLTPEIYQRIVEYYQKKRQVEDLKGLITPRYINSAVRFALAHARYLQKPEVEMVDVDVAVKLLDTSMRITAFDPLTQKLDPAIANGDMPTREVKIKQSTEDILRSAFKSLKDGTLRTEYFATPKELRQRLMENHGWTEEDARSVLAKYKKDGDFMYWGTYEGEEGWKLA